MTSIPRKHTTSGRGRTVVVAAWIAMPLLASNAQQNQNAAANFVKITAPAIALTHVRVIDGTGAPARENQTLIIRGGNIADIGDASRVVAPADATIVDLTGKRHPRARDDARASVLDAWHAAPTRST